MGAGHCSFRTSEKGESRMAQTTVHVRNSHDTSAAVGWTGNRTVTIDRAEQAGGMGLGFNGGELLLAIGACYTNDLYREAAKQHLTIRNVQVDVDADWGGDPVRAQNVSFSVKVEAPASEREILDLITTPIESLRSTILLEWAQQLNSPRQKQSQSGNRTAHFGRPC